MVRPILNSYSQIHLRTLSFHQDDPPPLVRLQDEHWIPLLDWARSEFNVEIKTFDSVLFYAQPKETKQKFDEVMSKFDPWQMAGTWRIPVRGNTSV